jgi:hypothetical protein
MGRLGAKWGRRLRRFRQAVGRGIKKAVDFYDKHSEAISNIGTVAGAVAPRLRQPYGRIASGIATGTQVAGVARGIARRAGY